MKTEQAIEFLKNEINGDNYKGIEGIIELLKGEDTYEELKKFIQETHDIYEPKIAWAYNAGYIDSLTDHTNIFSHSELNKLTILNEQLKGGE